MGKWALEIWAELFLKNEKTPDDQIFSGAPFAKYHCRPWKSWARKLFEGQKNNLYTVCQIFNFCENDYNSAENTKFLARSILFISANFVLSAKKMARWNRDTRGSSFLAIYILVRNNYKNWLSVERKHRTLPAQSAGACPRSHKRRSECLMKGGQLSALIVKSFEPWWENAKDVEHTHENLWKQGCTFSRSKWRVSVVHENNQPARFIALS